MSEKRALASRAARAEIILHWDDDDLHEPSRVSAQVAPIARGAAEVTALELSHMAAMPSMEVYAVTGPRRPLFSSLAYRASLGRQLSFLNVSLAEDVDFAERALRGCHRFLVVRGVHSLYTRHELGGPQNTYRLDLAQMTDSPESAQAAKRIQVAIRRRQKRQSMS